MSNYDVIVQGGGASGEQCALMAFRTEIAGMLPPVKPMNAQIVSLGG